MEEKPHALNFSLSKKPQPLFHPSNSRFLSRSWSTTLPFGFFETVSQIRVVIWALKRPNQPYFAFFWNSFLEIKWFGHLAFSWPFFNLEENVFFSGRFWLNVNKTYNILWYFKIYLIYLCKFSLKIWPLFGLFHHLKFWPFLKLLMAKFGLFYFWDLATLSQIYSLWLWLICLYKKILFLVTLIATA